MDGKMGFESKNGRRREAADQIANNPNDSDMLLSRWKVRKSAALTSEMRFTLVDGNGSF
jgi:hypothetical protein